MRGMQAPAPERRVDEFLEALKPPRHIQPPGELADRIMLAVEIERSARPLRWLLGLPLPFVLVAAGLVAVGWASIQDGSLASLVGALYGRLLETMLSPSPLALVALAGICVAVATVVSAVALSLLAWAEAGFAAQRQEEIGRVLKRRQR